MVDLAAKLAQARPASRSVKIVLDGQIGAEIDAAEAALAAPSDTLADPDKDRLRAQLDDLYARAVESEVEFTFRAISKLEMSRILTRTEGKADDDFAAALIAASSVDPEVDAETARKMLDTLSAGQWNLLFQTAQLVNMTPGEIPKSARRYAATRSSDSKPITSAE